jgi:hypothetical protein
MSISIKFSGDNIDAIKNQMAIFLNQGNAASSAAATDEPVATDVEVAEVAEVVAPKTRTRKPKAPKPEEFVMDETPAEAVETEEMAEAFGAEETPAPSLEDVIEAFRKYAKATSQVAAVTKLNSFGVKSVKAIPEERRAEVIAALVIKKK